MKLDNIIDNTKKTLGDYFAKTCEQRLATGIGSRYENIPDVAAMEAALRAADWTEANHPDIMPGCRAYITRDIKGGRQGVVALDDFDLAYEVIAVDPKRTGNVEVAIDIGNFGPRVEETWAIVGPENGVDVLYTFHPGEPIRPSQVPASLVPAGTKLRVIEALGLGFEYAKVF